MSNIMSEVTNLIDQDVSIRRGLTRGIINSRALAKYIHSHLPVNASLDAIISAIRRYESRDSLKEDVKQRYKVIAQAKVSSRTKMSSILFKKDMDVRNSLIKLYNKIDFSGSEVLRILEVSQWIKIIVDQKNLNLIEQEFNPKDILEVDESLGEISLIYQHGVINVPGIFAILASELASSDISIRDGVICGSEHIIIVKESDLMSALQVLHRISKWGEKLKT